MIMLGMTSVMLLRVLSVALIEDESGVAMVEAAGAALMKSPHHLEAQVAGGELDISDVAFSKVGASCGSDGLIKDEILSIAFGSTKECLQANLSRLATALSVP